MKVYALLSWFDEQPDHLRRCVTSLEGFADVLVAVDGAYATFPCTCPLSPALQHWALSDATRDAGLQRYFVSSGAPWSSEVVKRAAMFEYARQAGATQDDWLLIIDADMTLGEFTPDARRKLAATNLDVAEVQWHDLRIDGKSVSTHRFRSLFRALPGLTVERAHYLYVTPDGAPRRFLWHGPHGGLADIPTLDLFGDVTLHHFNSQRDPDRRQRALDYYKDRDARTLESAGDWRL